MNDQQQVSHYDQFGLRYRDEIVNSEDPSLWTTDWREGGATYQKMKLRVQRQMEFMLSAFTPSQPVLDLGCGFGRHAFALGKYGFSVVGVDGSKIFIDIAKSIFAKHVLHGEFHCCSIFEFQPRETYSQILLLDVFEHIEPSRRMTLLDHIAQHLCRPEAKVLVTIPHVESHNAPRRILRWLSRIVHLDQEHPYPIPNREELSHLVHHHFEIVREDVYGDTLFFLIQARG